MKERGKSLITTPPSCQPGPPSRGQPRDIKQGSKAGDKKLKVRRHFCIEALAQAAQRAESSPWRASKATWMWASCWSRGCWTSGAAFQARLSCDSVAPGMALQGRDRVEIVNPKTVLKLYSFAGRQEGGRGEATTNPTTSRLCWWFWSFSG